MLDLRDLWPEWRRTICVFFSSQKRVFLFTVLKFVRRRQRAHCVLRACCTDCRNRQHYGCRPEKRIGSSGKHKEILYNYSRLRRGRRRSTARAPRLMRVGRHCRCAARAPLHCASSHPDSRHDARHTCPRSHDTCSFSLLFSVSRAATRSISRSSCSCCLFSVTATRRVRRSSCCWKLPKRSSVARSASEGAGTGVEALATGPTGPAGVEALAHASIPHRWHCSAHQAVLRPP